uniref:FAST kinase domains 5 n=1 Tax=Canis lupus familiaris TaxID=9615 RepID=A0A8P0TU71_CANLF
MALAICRRFPGSFCGTPPRPALIKHHINKKLPGQTCEDCVLTGRMIHTDARMAATLKFLKPLGYQAFCNPFAYSATQSVTYWNVGSCTWQTEQDPPEHSSLCHPAKKVENINSTSSSQRLLTTSSALPGSETSRAPASQASTLKSGSPRAAGVVEEDIEIFDSFEDPRGFLQLRPEYQLHSYNRSETCQPLSVSEGELILHKVTVYQGNLQPQVIAEYFCKLSSLPAEQHHVVLSSTRFALLCQLSVKNIQLFDVPDLINILKAFVNLGIPPSHSMLGESRQVPQDLMQKLESLVLKYIDLINLEEIGTICLGFFKSSSSLSEYVMRKIGDLACADMQHLSNYALVNILKMFRFTHVDHVNFMKHFGQIAPQRIPFLGVQGVMHLTLACSALRVLDEGLMNAVAASLPTRVAYCRSKDIAKILWSFGTLNYKPPNTEEFYSALINEIHRKMPEFNRYPEHLLTCLLGLAFSEYFPFELINFALSPEFVKLAQARSKFELTKELYTLDGIVGTECLDYRGNRLSAHLQQEGSEMLWNLARKDMCSKPEFLEALFLLETMLGGSQYIKHHMILPHTRSSDLEVQLDVNMKPLPFNREAIPVEEEATLKLKHVGVSLTDDLMNQLLQGKSRKPTQGETESETEPRARELEKTAIHLGSSPCSMADRLGADRLACMQAPQVKLAIQLTNKNQYCYASRDLLGLHNMKRRQLNQLGYRVVELFHWEWLPLLKRTRLEKLMFLHEKVFTSTF